MKPSLTLVFYCLLIKQLEFNKLTTYKVESNSDEIPVIYKKLISDIKKEPTYFLKMSYLYP